jgi:putative flippase GtrA
MSRLGKDALRFAVVGTAGFLVDSLILTYLMCVTEWNPFLARVVSISVAIFLTWFLHRHWTFLTGSCLAPFPQILIYLAVQFTGLLINYAIFSILIVTGGLWLAHPVLAISAGSLTAMGITFLLSRTVAFAAPRGTTVVGKNSDRGRLDRNR